MIDMKNKYLLAIMFVFAVMGLVPVLSYFFYFHSGFSTNHQSWGEFGSFYGGILGPTAAVLAFICLVWNLEVTAKQFKRQSEESRFFNLLGLHNKIVESINNQYTGPDAFKKYVDNFKSLYSAEAQRVARREISENTRNLSFNAYAFLWKKLRPFLHEIDEFYDGGKEKQEKMISFFESSSDRWELQKGIIGDDNFLSQKDKDTLRGIGEVVIEDSTPKFRIEIMQYINDLFYQDYGHILGRYFRNIYYLLKFINESEMEIEYSKIFRAQLSRYELALLYYNALGTLSGTDYINLLIKYDIFNGIYGSDICYYLNKNKFESDLSSRLKDFG